jgi:hypothetical protein
MSGFRKELRTAVLLLSIPVLTVAAGCAGTQQIPEEAIRGRADRAFEDLRAEETGQKRKGSFKESKRQPNTEQKNTPQAKSGKRPGWVDGRATKYPAEGYLTGVGFGDTRKAAEDSAYAATSRIFQAEISSRTKEWEKYAQTEIKGKVQTTRDIEISQLTSVATEKVLEDIAIAEVWLDEPEKLIYALAVMDRAHAAAVLRERITEMDRDVLDLQNKAANSPDKLEAVRTLRRAMRISLNRDVYNTDLRIVNPAGKGIDPPVSLISIKEKIHDLVTNHIRMGVEVRGPHHERIRSAILEGLTKEGFSLEQSGGQSTIDVLVKGNVSFEKADLPEWKFVRWAFSVNLVNNKNGKIFGSLTKHGKEAHLNFSEAEQRAVRALQKEIVNELSALMVSFIYGHTTEG